MGILQLKKNVLAQNAKFSNLSTTNIPPATVGITKPVITDINGNQSFLDQQIMMFDTITTTSNIVAKTFTLNPYTTTRFEVQALATTLTGGYNSRKAQTFYLNGSNLVNSGTLRDLEPNENLGSIAAGLGFTLTNVGNDVRLTLINNGQSTDWKLIIKIDKKSTFP